MSKQFALTTSDNPFSPITQFDEWFEYDEEKGYHTCSYLARIAATSPDLSDADNDEEIERAVDEIVKLNLLGIVTEYAVNYVKKTDETSPQLSSEQNLL